ncbi:DNA-binding transcriptional regulator, MarR family [Paenibacillus sp. UNC496MF]|uniref:MarR family winged helix-turn-helix transcriptional regulator n=1 Tax=Paenibacillus sp. UNC496MF TaxID=1502753 RepID=UPI0008E44DD2|nr:MarR family winged helix-turn-helix transcriptional regulator [Paenibacillus sp. UNC496MF]SFJ83562.1 DNA-binding transcriptional regulator, MarR family [Paenibacillus sp. UNC496MF]
MNDNRQDIIQRLRDAFILFAKAEWREKPVNGLTRSDIRILFSVMEYENNGNPKPRISDLSKRLLVTTPTVTQLIKKLIEEDLIERTVDPDDRRSVGIGLTAKGKEVAKSAELYIRDSLGGLIDDLGEDESRQLAELLTKAYHYFNNREGEK